jgi:hypothetical protein
MEFGQKLCPRCVKMRSEDSFKPRPDGTLSCCRDCELGYFREYNKKRYISPEARAKELEDVRKKYREIKKPLRMARKLQLIMLFGGACIKCGYNKSTAALDFDHLGDEETARGKPNKNKKRTVSHLLGIEGAWAWVAALEEARKCQLICSNCHRERTYPGHEFRDRVQPEYDPELSLEKLLDLAF